VPSGINILYTGDNNDARDSAWISAEAFSVNPQTGALQTIPALTVWSTAQNPFPSPEFDIPHVLDTKDGQFYEFNCGNENGSEACADPAELDTYTINPQTGAYAVTSSIMTHPGKIVVDPADGLVFVETNPSFCPSSTSPCTPNSFPQQVDEFRRDPQTGALAATSNVLLVGNWESQAVPPALVNPQGGALYIPVASPDITQLALLGIRIDPTTGAMSQLPGFPVSENPNQPDWMVQVHPSGRYSLWYESGTEKIIRPINTDGSLGKSPSRLEKRATTPTSTRRAGSCSPITIRQSMSMASIRSRAHSRAARSAPLRKSERNSL
jgi:hypothetical protein